jgi:hypothetical protein
MADLVAALQFVVPNTTTPDHDTGWEVVRKCEESSVMLFAPVGVGGGAIKFNPPHIISKEALAEGLEVVPTRRESFAGGAWFETRPSLELALVLAGRSFRRARGLESADRWDVRSPGIAVSQCGRLRFHRAERSGSDHPSRVRDSRRGSHARRRAHPNGLADHLSCRFRTCTAFRLAKSQGEDNRALVEERRDFDKEWSDYRRERREHDEDKDLFGGNPGDPLVDLFKEGPK